MDISWAIAEVLRCEMRSRGYSINRVLELIAQISPQNQLSQSSVERMLQGEHSCRPETFNILLQALELDREWVFAEAKKKIDWQKVWRDVFNKDAQPTISHVLSGDGFTQQHTPSYFEPNLVVYSHPIRYPIQTHSLSEKQSINPLQKLSLKRFKEAVLLPFMSKKVKSPARIVILGEAGSGKSMLLNHIGNWIFAHKNNSATGKGRIAVIRVPLGELNLRKKSIEDHIFNPLLKQALGLHSVPDEVKEQLVDLFKEGKVWLLLDGIDEVVRNSKDLLKLEQQLLKGVLASANLMLSCRPHVWENESNSLRDQFKSAYQLQGLDPITDRSLGQIGKFINCYLPKPLAKQLILKLQDPQYAATRSLATNPLLVSLLCYTFHRWQEQDGLPTTKAHLYQKFVEYLYDVKPQLGVFDSFQQSKLNQTLGILAFRALDQSSSPYRLPRSFVLKVWQEAKLSPKLLYLFEKLGFLGQMGVAEETQDERVYLFLHPSLQEYFAALVINHRHLLLNLNDPSHVVDRVLQFQWNRVYLFCMGGDWLDEPQKESLLQDLINCNYYCNEYYYHSGVCLAAQGIAEFKASRLSDAIIGQLVDWSLEGWNPDEKPRNYNSAPKINMAARYLALSDSKRVVEYLKQQLQLSQGNCDRSYQVASRLAELVQLLQCDSEEVRDNAASLLSKLQPSHPVLKEYLENCLRSSKEPDQLFAIDLLQKMGRKIPDLVSMLVNVCETSQNNEIQKYAASLLFEVAPNHAYAAPQQKAGDASDYSSIPVQQVLVWISLLESAKRHKDSDQLLLRLHSWLKDKQNLGKLLKNEEQTIRVICTLKRWLNLSDEHSFEFQLCNQSLYHCAQFIPYTIFCKGWN
jgi:energy-coupling factor transporter ATP-binding protein EcfA2